MANKDQPLKVDLTGGTFTLTIGVSQICKSVAGGTVFEDFDCGEALEIVDEDAFARAIAAQLVEVIEGRDTLVHLMLDTAARKAIAAGAAGVRFPGGV